MGHSHIDDTDFDLSLFQVHMNQKNEVYETHDLFLASAWEFPVRKNWAYRNVPVGKEDHQNQRKRRILMDDVDELYEIQELH